jgi:hypothetical protein
MSQPGGETNDHQERPPGESAGTGAMCDGSSSMVRGTVDQPSGDRNPDAADTSPIGSSKRVMKDRNSKTS